MYASVQSAWSGFTQPFEGRVHWMYPDIKGLITTGVGNLIDPKSLAMPLPWTHKSTGVRATQDETGSEWDSIKAKSPTLKKSLYTACEAITELRLSDSDIDALVLSKLQANEKVLKGYFALWDSWPADAQLGVLSMAWGLGGGFPPQWPKFTAAANSGDWVTAAAECKMSEAGNPGVIKRNVADAALFSNAAAVIANKADPSVLYYPGQPPASPTSGDAGAPNSSAGTDPTPDTSTPDTSTPDTSASDTSASDTSTPDTSMPSSDQSASVGSDGSTAAADGATSSPESTTASPDTPTSTSSDPGGTSGTDPADATNPSATADPSTDTTDPSTGADSTASPTSTP